MKPWHSSSLACFTLLTACLFGTVASYGTFGPLSSPVAQLCDMWKTDPTANVSFLAMGIISEAGGESRFYAVTTRFEGITVPADQLYDPRDPVNQAAPYKEEDAHWPHINLHDADALDLKVSQDSWPHGEPFPGDGKGATILAFKPESGFHSGEKFLAYITRHSTELFLASLANPEARISKVPIGGHSQPPSRTVFSTDNKLTPSGDTAILASLRFLNHQTTTLDCLLKRAHEDTLLFVPVHSEHPTQVQATLEIDGGFLINGHLDTEALFFAFSNTQRKVYVFYGKEEAPVEVTFNDFLMCPNEWLQKGLWVGGIALPVLFLLFAFCCCCGAKKTKNAVGAPFAGSRKRNTVSAIPSGATASGTSTVSTGTRRSTFATASGNPSMRTQTSSYATVSSAPAARTRTSRKPRTPKKKKSGTPNKKSTNSPGGLPRSMESSPASKRGVFKFKAAK